MTTLDTAADVVNLPVITGLVDDGFNSLASSSATATLLRGDRIKFRKDEYPIGRDEGDARGVELAAYGVDRAQQKWHDNQLVAQIAASDTSPFPETVDDIPDDGSPGEWRLSYFLYLRDLQSGRDYTFVSSSNGGRRAVASLAAAIRNKRRTTPGAIPIIRLDAGGFKTQSYGTVACPVFTITGWVDTDGKPLSAAPLSVELNDSIPF